MKQFVSFVVAVLVCLVIQAQENSSAVSQDSVIAVQDSLVLELADSAVVYVPRVSLLTCSPASEVWQQYGHTAIRFVDAERDVDVVFNYGLFDFAAPHFIWRFCLGKTDYIVGAETYDSFRREYVERGSSITEQQLNLLPEETVNFWNLITTNCRPENRTYRYDFFYNNCSTKARDILYQSLESDVSIARTDSVSLRSILHRHNAAYPWASFGIDLLLGVKADHPVPHDVQEFAPLSLEESFAKATRNDGEPFVTGTTVVQPLSSIQGGGRFPLTPVQMMIIVLLITAIVCTFELLSSTRQWWYDVVLYSIQGVAGVIVTFLFLFSTHPTVDSNILVVVLNPLAFVLLLFLLRQSRRRTIPWAAMAEVGLIVVLAVVWLFIRQEIPTAAWVFICALLLRSAHHIIKGIKGSKRLKRQ